MCVYMHHLHIHAPHAPWITTKYKIYLVDLPSVLYERSGQNETSVLNQLFLWLSGAFHVLLMKALLFIQEVYQSSWKPSKLGQYVCIHALFTHTCTTKYHQNIRYTLLAFPLYSMKDQVKMRHLCWISCFCCFSGAFHKKVPLFMKTNKTRSICVYTCTIYTYMHHQLPRNIRYT